MLLDGYKVDLNRPRSVAIAMQVENREVKKMCVKSILKHTSQENR